MKIDIKATKDALVSAHSHMIELHNALNTRLRDELGNLIEIEDREQLLIEINYNIYADKLTFYLILKEQETTRHKLDYNVECNFADIVISTTTRDATIIKKLVTFSERNIIGAYNANDE